MVRISCKLYSSVPTLTCMKCTLIARLVDPRHATLSRSILYLMSKKNEQKTSICLSLGCEDASYFYLTELIIQPTCCQPVQSSKANNAKALSQYCDVPIAGRPTL
ncbi:hypothetical protein VHEMI06788 [[Torrubiella] hemipterigena]|uniref:Uncharacterized protein n=1 Tax=[Torrubiella] hemipterigena TaxID=1531966 RepID=A0A0A1TK97_9HYPO|nr:hypothetical protein VHEMI06788 [[Torrubiella] hemipterigena]